ncbi:hypothetical protein H4Q26_018263 [Puccinia striiformis f. sp. tritici PST-130]|nr:hypothetical protein H4Q26_018263 [Puccinia striiformis f. sp. tritici PST-130]
MFSTRFLGGIILLLAMIGNGLGKPQTQTCRGRGYMYKNAEVLACKDPKSGKCKSQKLIVCRAVTPPDPRREPDLINHYLTVVKQQRADNPPPPPFVDPLTPDERLDGIIKTVLADQESRLINRLILIDPSENTWKLLLDETPSTNLATFNIRFERYQEALVQAQEIEVQATQTKDKTVIPTTKNLKIESRTAQTEHIALPAPEVTGNIHLDNYLAKKSITEKPIDKKEKSTRKKLLPLDSSIGDLSISSFTTEPYFEDLEPTTNSPSPALKKSLVSQRYPSYRIQRTSLTKQPHLEPLHPDPERRAKQSRNPIRSSKPRRNRANTPNPWGLSANPSRRTKVEPPARWTANPRAEDEIPEAEIIRILIKKQVKIHAKYLKATSNKERKRYRNPTNGTNLVKAEATAQTKPTRTTTETKLARPTVATEPIQHEQSQGRRTTTQDRLTRTKQQRYREESEDLETQ